MTVVKQSRIRRQELNRGYLNVLAFAQSFARGAIGLLGRVIAFNRSHARYVADRAWLHDAIRFT